MRSTLGPSQAPGEDLPDDAVVSRSMPIPSLVLGAAALLCAASLGATVHVGEALFLSAAASPALGPGLWMGLALGLALGGVLAARRASEQRRPARTAALPCLALGGLFMALPLALDGVEDLLGILAGSLAAIGAMESETLATLAAALPTLLFGLLLGTALGEVSTAFLRARCENLDLHGQSLGRLALAAALGGLTLLLLRSLFGETLGSAGWTRGCALLTWGAALLLLLADRALPHGIAPPAGGQPGTVSEPRALGLWTVLAGVSLSGALLALWRVPSPLLDLEPSAPGLAVTFLALGGLLGLFVGGELAALRGGRGYGAAWPLLATGLLVIWAGHEAGKLPSQLLLAPPGGWEQGVGWYLMWQLGPIGFAAGLTCVGCLAQHSQWSGLVARELGLLVARLGLGLALGLALGELSLGLGATPGVLLTATAGALLLISLGIQVTTTARLSPSWIAVHLLALILLGLPPVHGALIDCQPDPSLTLAAGQRVPEALRLRDATDLPLFTEFFGGSPAAAAHLEHGPSDDATATGDGARGLNLHHAGLWVGQHAVGDTQGTALRELGPAVLAACLHRSPKRVLLVGWGSGRGAPVLRGAPAQVVVSDAPAHLRQLARHALPQADEASPEGHVSPRAHSGALCVLAAARGSEPRYDVIVSWNSDPAAVTARWLRTPRGLEQAHGALTPSGMLLLAVQPGILGSEGTDQVCRDMVRRFERVLAIRMDSQVVLVGQRNTEPLAMAHWTQLLEREGRLASLAKLTGLISAADLLSRLRADETGLRRTLRMEDAGERPVNGPTPTARGADARRDPLAGLLIDSAFPPDWNTWLPNHQIQEFWLVRATQAALLRGDLSAARALAFSPALGEGIAAARARAHTLLQLEQGEVAERLLRDALAALPDDEEVRGEWLEALAYRPEGSEAGPARASLLAALDGLPKQGGARLWQAAARTARELGDPQLSARCYRQALAVSAGAPPAGVRVELARLLVAAGELAEAQEALTLLLEEPDLADDPVGLDLAMRLEGRLGDATRADALEQQLGESAARRAHAPLRAALAHLRARDFLAGYSAAEQAATLDGSLSLARQIQAICALCMPTQGAAADLERRRMGSQALADALERLHPDGEGRIARIAHWFGLSLATENTQGH